MTIHVVYEILYPGRREVESFGRMWFLVYEINLGFPGWSRNGIYILQEMPGAYDC